MSKLFTVAFLILGLAFSVYAKKEKEPEKNNLFKESTFSGIMLRNIGPAFMSGRISDVKIHPEDDNIWYVAVGSGGVWKTVNAGTTWTPVFDKQKVYSIGCVTIDPNNPHTVWVGTGEDVGGRHVGFGDGVYRSDDDGIHWKNMGLKNTQHISRIIVHPENSNIVWVAAQGPLWSKGDERGLYKTTDGGKNWKKVLGDAEWTGVTDVVIDPRNPDCLYAATWQRHRNVAAYIGGGPGTAIYRSDNGGKNWTKLSEGLPKTFMGKIGLAISLQKPDVVYAAIELDRRTGGVYKSENKGAYWTKQSDVVAGATGPHYYQELYACPHEFDRLYLVDNNMQISDDGGKTFIKMNEKDKHGDNHAIAFRKDDPDYLLVGSDGGLYESFDLAKTWRFMANLPVTQFYKVALDDSEPFYKIYGGTQDNSTQGGPSRTDNASGIRNSDWEVVLFADGHQPATEPGNPDIVYAEWQQGNLVRTDRTTGEIVYIQPQCEKGEKKERFNWDAPILVSPHSPTRLYYASQRVWRSDDRGDSWKTISGDLTKNQDRLNLPIMGKKWGWDAAWDMSAMSFYNTITSLAESPKQEGLIYAGTDDGHIQVTENGGESWRKIEVASLPGIPATAFVNDIKADLYNSNTVYVALDNHKFGDFKPYLMKSTDKGNTWTSMTGNIPDKTLVWRIVQDHVNPELFFLATEFGIYFTVDAGQKWTKFTGGVPTISFRDLAIQKRENDLVGASFGRGFFVMDDYSFLRDVTTDKLEEKAALFTTRDALWYIEREPLGGNKKGSQGSSLFTAPNPPFGAVFTYYLKDGFETDKEKRQKKEKKLHKENKDIEFAGWDAVEAERRQEKPEIWLTIKDMEGNVIRRLNGPATKGFHRVAWDLRYPAKLAIGASMGYSEGAPKGILAVPGTYTATLSSKIDGVVEELSAPIEFKVKQMRQGALKGSTPDQLVEFLKELAEAKRVASAMGLILKKNLKKVEAMKTALARTSAAPGELDKELHQLRAKLLDLDEKLNGNRAKLSIVDNDTPNVMSRLMVAEMGTQTSTYGPTPTHKQSLDIAKEDLKAAKAEMQKIIDEDLQALETKLLKAGAPWVDGMSLP